MSDQDSDREALVHAGTLIAAGRPATYVHHSARELLTELGVSLAPTLTTLADDAKDPAAAEVSASAEQLGRRFRVLREIGRGGMGRVLEAHDAELRRVVAIKVIVDPSIDPSLIERFVAEAQITAQLEHPGIVPVYDIGVGDEGTLFFVMKRVHGQSLRQILAAIWGGDEGARVEHSRHRLLTAFVRICQAVAYAHQRGVIHRDLKPANIMFGGLGEVLVMDWGIARVLTLGDVDRAPGRASLGGTSVGTPGYMSPEQMLGEGDALTPASDVWSLGVILFEMLTIKRAFSGTFGQLLEQVSASPLDPRQTMGHSVADELAEIVMTATAVTPSRRYRSAAELATAVEGFLEGSRRRQLADERLAEARVAALELDRWAETRARVAAGERELSRQIPAWAPLERKAELEQARRALEELEPARAASFARLVASCERALEQDVANADARAMLARAYCARLVEAEVQRDPAGQRFFEARAREFDDGPLAGFLEGTGALTLATEPAGAHVLCRRYCQVGLVWSLGEPVTLGRTPLVHVPLPMGSYLLTLSAPGMRDTHYPVHITRGRSWTSGPTTLPLLGDAEIGEDFVYVPAGPCIIGNDAQAPGSLPADERWVEGFVIAKHPVTMGEYCAFINDLHTRDPEQAWARVPRSASSLDAGSGEYWERAAPGERYRVPERDHDGDAWDPSWPAMAISWRDAAAYASWITRQTGREHCLVPELWWEKAARGVDGRFHPWGDRFDPALCHMRQSRPGRPLPAPVGSFVHDCSVYGVRDVAGCIREWAGDATFDGISEMHPVRGGSWDDHPRHCRIASRLDQDPWNVKSQVGFRIARPLRSAGTRA